MQEDLSMYGNQLVTSTSIWTVGYVIGQIPSNLLLTRLSPRIVIPTVCQRPACSFGLTSLTDFILSARSRLGSRNDRHICSFILQGAVCFEIPGWVVRVSQTTGSISHSGHSLFPFRSGFYPGIHYLLGSWYTPRELGKRAMIFWLAGSMGQLFSGFLQAAAYTGLNGVHGRAGWR